MSAPAPSCARCGKDLAGKPTHNGMPRRFCSRACASANWGNAFKGIKPIGRGKR